MLQPYNIVVHHVSIYGSEDGNLDIGTGAHDVTISWSIFIKPAGTEKNMLINNEGTETMPFPAPTVDIIDACGDAHQVLREAALPARHSVEQQYLGAIMLSGC